MKVGDYAVIKDTNDNDLAYWLEEQEEKNITKHLIVDIDKELGVFWVENCDYAIWLNEDIFYLV